MKYVQSGKERGYNFFNLAQQQGYTVLDYHVEDPGKPLVNQVREFLVLFATFINMLAHQNASAKFIEMPARHPFIIISTAL